MLSCHERTIARRLHVSNLAQEQQHRQKLRTRRCCSYGGSCFLDVLQGVCGVSTSCIASGPSAAPAATSPSSGGPKKTAGASTPGALSAGASTAGGLSPTPFDVLVMDSWCCSSPLVDHSTPCDDDCCCPDVQRSDNQPALAVVGLPSTISMRQPARFAARKRSYSAFSLRLPVAASSLRCLEAFQGLSMQPKLPSLLLPVRHACTQPTRGVTQQELSRHGTPIRFRQLKTNHHFSVTSTSVEPPYHSTAPTTPPPRGGRDDVGFGVVDTLSRTFWRLVISLVEPVTRVKQSINPSLQSQFGRTDGRTKKLSCDYKCAQARRDLPTRLRPPGTESTRGSSTTTTTTPTWSRP